MMMRKTRSNTSTSTTVERADSKPLVRKIRKIAEAARHGLASVDLEVQHQIMRGTPLTSKR